MRTVEPVDITLSRDPVVCVLVTATALGTCNVHELGVKSCSCEKADHKQSYGVEFHQDLGSHLVIIKHT